MGTHAHRKRENYKKNFFQEKKSLKRAFSVCLSLVMCMNRTHVLHPTRQHITPPACVIKCMCLKHSQTLKIKHHKTIIKQETFTGSES